MYKRMIGWISVFSISVLFFSAFADDAPQRSDERGASLPSSTPADVRRKDRKLALVIGNADYTHIPALDNPVNDARDTCKALASLGFETLCYENVPTRREMKAIIADYVERLRGGAIGLFYYAGHGLQVRGENYIVPTTALLRVEADVEDETLSLGYFMNRLEETKNPFNIVILDACRNNPLVPKRVAKEGGLAPLDAPAGTMVIYATAPGQVAIDGERGSRNGIFTAHLLKNIARKGITVEEMFKAVIGGVQDETLRKYRLQQVPWMNSSYTGKFCFSGCEDAQIIQELARIKQEREELEKRASQLDSDRLERDKKIGTLETEVLKTRTEMALRSQEIEKLQIDAAKNASKPSAERELITLQKQLKQLEETNTTLAKQTLKLQKENDELEALKKRLGELEKQSEEIQTLNKRLADMQREREQLIQEVAPAQQNPADRKTGPRPSKRRVVPSNM